MKESHILIEDEEGQHFAIKKTDIRRVYTGLTKKTIVTFSNPKVNRPITVKGSVKDFFCRYLGRV